MGTVETRTRDASYHTIPIGTFGTRLLTGWWRTGRKSSSTWGLPSEHRIGVPDPTASHRGPFSYKAYLTKMLDKQFWGDEIVLWSVPIMWGLKIMVVNSKMLQEY